MSVWLRVGGATIRTVAAMAEISAFLGVLWAFIFPDRAAEVWVRFQQHIAVAEERLTAIDAKLGTANEIAAAIEASNRAIEASNNAIAESGRAIEASNQAIAESSRAVAVSTRAIEATTALMAQEQVTQTDIQGQIRQHTGMSAQHAERMAQVAGGLVVGAWLIAGDLGFDVENGSTSSLDDVTLTVYDSRESRVRVLRLGRIGRDREATQYAPFDIGQYPDQAVLNTLTVCISTVAEGDDAPMVLLAQMRAEWGLAPSGGDTVWIMDGVPQTAEVCPD